jgi:hypothetical protein
MDRQGDRDIVEDARLLATYAFHRGTLPEGSGIFELIDQAEQALAGDQRFAHAPLLAEVANVAKSAGITVRELQKRGTTLGKVRLRATLATPYLLGLMTLLLTLYLAFQSSELHKADLALREYQELVNERLQEKIYLAWKLYYYEHVISAKAPPLRQLDDYQKLVDDAKRLHEKRTAVQNLLRQSSIVRYMPELFQYSGPCWLQRFSAVMNSSDPATAVSQSCSALSKEGGGLKEATDAAGSLACDARSVKSAASDKNLELDDYARSVGCFVRSLGISDDYEPVSPVIYATRDKVSLLVSWFLPGLYGLLGACVFLMRDLLAVNGGKEMRGDKRIVDLLSLLLRVALGGLAGIIIGWFWVPSGSTGGAASAIPVSSVSFGVAFLAGFSIDILFSLLDRANKAIGESTPAKRPDDMAQTREPKAAEPVGSASARGIHVGKLRP